MALTQELGEIVEYRGVEGLVAAEVLMDDNETNTASSGETPNHGYVTGEVFSIAGIAELSRSTENSTEAHYYDNMPAIVINSVGADEITCTVSAIPMEVLAKITGQTFDAATGAYIEGQGAVKYFALGYKTKKTNGDEVYVWRYKGTFGIPESTHTTEDDGTDANGQEIVYTGISTTHKFTKTGKGAKAINVDLGLDKADVSTFFDEVTTPDTLEAKASYSLTITQGEGTAVTVKKGNVTLTTGATIYAGDVLTISVTGGTLEVNDESFVSGNTHIVTGNVTVESTVTA